MWRVPLSATANAQRARSASGEPPLAAAGFADRDGYPTSLWDLIDPAHRDLDELRRFVPAFDFLLLDLTETSDEALARDIDSERGKLVLAALKHAAYEASDARWLEGWIAVAARLVTTEPGLSVVQVIVQYLLEVTDTPAERVRTVLTSALAAQDVERVMSTAEKLRQEGREEGLIQGRREGLRQGRAEQLLRLLTVRFGPPPDETTSRVHAASIVELDRWAEAALTAPTLDDVFA